MGRKREKLEQLVYTLRGNLVSSLRMLEDTRHELDTTLRHAAEVRNKNSELRDTLVEIDRHRKNFETMWHEAKDEVEEHKVTIRNILISIQEAKAEQDEKSS